MICVLTYDTPHRKTQDVLLGLKARGHNDVCVAATPFVPRKVLFPLYKHRPSDCEQVELSEFCARLSYELVKTTTAGLEQLFTDRKFDHIIIAGAGLLPENLPVKFKIINSHPGYLPFVKGLDSLKWAIYNDAPVGVTLHYISPEADEGLLIDQVLVPLHAHDTFESFAHRQYDIEIDLLVRSTEILEGITVFHDLTDKSVMAGRRMPRHIEEVMMERFNERRKKVADTAA